MKKLFTIILLAIAVFSLQAQTLTQDPDVRKGQLKNGLTYYIRHNAKEAGLADFYIAQRVGSILEEPRQRGLAHFLEHMAFNGTKHFPGKNGKPSIVPWCETIGVRFGTNLNAYTSVDQTVYNISAAPISRAGVLDSCLLILNDWSHYILLEDKEIDKERGVIHEEWRTRRAGMAMQRLQEDVMPIIYKGSKYEDCLPIGSMDIVDHFPYNDLRDYYQKWYRPDLQAIIIVGDIDVNQVEQKVKKLFSKIPLPKQRAERIYYPVPDNDTMIVAVKKDAEQPIVLSHLYMKREAVPDEAKDKVQYLRDDYIDGLITSMLNSRLSELRQQAEPPFMSATAHSGTFYVSRTKEAFSLSVSCKQDNILGGLMSAVAAVEQARQHGFTQSELDRAKTIYMTRAQRQYESRNDRRNGTFVNQCLRHFLTSEPILTPEARLNYAKQMDQSVTLDEVNRATAALITDQNQILTLFGPDKEGCTLPDELTLRQVVTTAQKQSYSAYEEAPLDEHLIDQLPQPGTIVSEKPYQYGFTEITLSNGMKVYFRQTDFSADAVEMTIKGEGGTSLYPDADIPNFSIITSAVTEGGIGKYDAVTLRKMLTGKTVRVSPSVGSRGQSITASSSVKDIQTMFELTYLYFTQPRRDTVAYQGFINRTRSFLTNRNASPKVDYNDSISAILYGNHPRHQPVTQAVIDRADYDRVMQIYSERFADAANFQTVIIGNVSIETLRPLLCQYLAALPATHRQEKTNWSNVAQITGGESVHRFKKKQATPLANVSIYYSADIPFTAENDLALDFLGRVLRIAYTDSIREEKGGTYGVSVVVNFDREDQPNALMRISYNADPDRYDELNPMVYEQLRLIADNGPEPSSMDKVKKYLVKQYAQAAITNDYWDYIIWHQLDDGVDFDKDYCQLVENMTAAQVQDMARRFINAKRCIEVTMLSE